jgi:hypothetical protein
MRFGHKNLYGEQQMETDLKVEVERFLALL